MSNAPTSEYGYQGTLSPPALAGDFNAQLFIITQLSNRIHTATPVKVVAVTNAGGVAEVGYVDILPLINPLDGFGNAWPHKVIHRCPYLRMQGGANAVILDPQVGDIGIAIFADKDINSVIKNRANNMDQVNPGSFRRFDMADGMYLGGILNAAPTQYVEFSTAGIKLHSPTAIILDAPDIQLTAPTVEVTASTSVTVTTPTFQLNGALVATGLVTSAGKVLSTHTHSGVTAGSGVSGAPV